MVSKRMEKPKTIVLYSVFCFVLFFSDMLGREESSWGKQLGTGKQ